MKFKPAGPRILIEPSDAEGVVGKIIIPDVAIQKPVTGYVRALGTQPDHKWQFKIGDKVIMPQYGGYTVTVDKKEYRVLMEDDLLGTLEGE